MNNPRVSCAGLLVALLVVVVPNGCGKRGLPLAPLLVLPEPVTELLVRRFEDRSYIQLLVPLGNSDGSQPADLEHLEVYGLTTQPRDGDRPLSLDDWLDAATLVATISVRPSESNEVAAEPETAVDALVAPRADGSWAQGDVVVIVETLTPEIMVPVDLERDEDDEGDEADDERSAPALAPLVSPPIPQPPRRTYVVIGVSSRGRESSPSPRVAVVLVPSPDEPSRPMVTYTETAIDVSWIPPASVRLPVQQTSDDEVLETVANLEVLETVANLEVLETVANLEWPMPSRYEIYDVTPRSAATVSLAVETMPEALNESLLSNPSYPDERIEFGVERCYAVRLVDIVDSMEVRSPASGIKCVTPVDTFAPTAPTGVTVIADVGAINLVWNENPEPDVVGYVVLRGVATGETLQPLSADLVEETTYRDTMVQLGERYIYAVEAVDAAEPPNVSQASVPVVETAR